MEGPSGWNLMSSIYHQSRSDKERLWPGSHAERGNHQPVCGSDAADGHAGILARGSYGSRAAPRC